MSIIDVFRKKSSEKKMHISDSENSVNNVDQGSGCAKGPLTGAGRLRFTPIDLTADAPAPRQSIQKPPPVTSW